MAHLASAVISVCRTCCEVLEPNLWIDKLVLVATVPEEPSCMHKEDDDAIRTYQQEDDGNANNSLPEDDDSTNAAGYSQTTACCSMVCLSFGLSITVDEGNRRVVSNTDGLLSKIMVPVSSSDRSIAPQ